MKNENKIESILNSLEGMQRAEPRPFFFTRLEARMQKGDAFESIIRFISRPAVVITSVLLIIFINAFTIFSSLPDQSQSNMASQEIASVDEYIQISSNLFDTEKSNP